MSALRRISVLGLLGLFLLVNAGVGIYTHSCSMSGVERSYLVKGEDPCEDLHAKKRTSCCDEEQDQAEEKGCCSTDTEYVQLDVDATTNDYVVQFFILPVIREPLSFNLPTSEFKKEPLKGQYYVHPPPKYQGRDLQCIHQVYTI